MMFKKAFDPGHKKHLTVLGADMTYIEHGSGDPIVFLHGNPTSSFLWRKVIPAVAGQGRCVAPDLIGMGDSAKIATGPNSYRFTEHREYLDVLLELLGIVENVVLVGHDWGGALAFDWARRHHEAVRGVAYMETIVTKLTWDDWPEPATEIFRAMRSDAGEEIVLNKNVFVERILPSSVVSPLPDEVMAVYRAPYLEPGESRRPTLTWPREIPIDGKPEDVAGIVAASEEWMSASPVPKLFINADPGSILVGRQREVCRSWPNQVEVTVRGTHFILEDSGASIGQALSSWMGDL